MFKHTLIAFLSSIRQYLTCLAQACGLCLKAISLVAGGLVGKFRIAFCIPADVDAGIIGQRQFDM